MAPHIAEKFNRGWSPDDEKRRFATWWLPDSAEIMLLDGAPVGWLAWEAANTALTLVNFVVIKQYRGLGIGSIILGSKMNEWASHFKTFSHSLLKGSEHAAFFERFGFRTQREDDIVVFMEATLP
jgi:hypothetical protein